MLVRPSSPPSSTDARSDPDVRLRRRRHRPRRGHQPPPVPAAAAGGVDVTKMAKPAVADFTAQLSSCARGNRERRKNSTGVKRRAGIDDVLAEPPLLLLMMTATGDGDGGADGEIDVNVALLNRCHAAPRVKSALITLSSSASSHLCCGLLSLPSP